MGTHLETQDTQPHVFVLDNHRSETRFEVVACAAALAVRGRPGSCPWRSVASCSLLLLLLGWRDDCLLDGRGRAILLGPMHRLPNLSEKSDELSVLRGWLQPERLELRLHDRSKAKVWVSFEYERSMKGQGVLPGVASRSYFRSRAWRAHASTSCLREGSSSNIAQAWTKRRPL